MFIIKVGDIVCTRKGESMGQSIKVNGRPVFASPAGENVLECSSRPIDLVHLARQTGGNRALEEEVLQLFSRQAAKLSNQFGVMRDAESVKLAAHTIKGAASAVGAYNVAKFADALEAAPSERQCIKQLVAEMQHTCDYISSLLR